MFINPVSLKNQIVILSGQPATVKVDVKMPGNYPVDLYYLMDLSGSMVEDLKRFPTLGDSIGKGNQLNFMKKKTYGRIVVHEKRIHQQRDENKHFPFLQRFLFSISPAWFIFCC